MPRRPALAVETLEPLDLPSGSPVSLGDLTTAPAGSDPEQFVSAGPRAFFVAAAATTGSELYVTDGTAAGTALVADILPGAGGSGIQGMTAVGDRVYFSADDGVRGRELWVSDGTAAGTTLVADLNPGAGDGVQDTTFVSLPKPPVTVARAGGSVFFVGTDGTRINAGVTPAYKLWRATAGVATPLTETKVLGLAAVGDRVYYPGTDPATGLAALYRAAATGGPELVRTFGTGTGNSQDTLTGLTAYGDRLAFFGNVSFASPAASRPTLYLSDGTAAGTAAVALPAGFRTDLFGIDSGDIPAPAAVTGALYFVGGDSSTGQELWRSDGTPAGTGLVADIVPGATDAFGRTGTGQSFRSRFVPAGGAVYFVAGVGGRTLFKSAGTAAGTVPATDLPGGRYDNLAAVGGGVYFSYAGSSGGGPPVPRGLYKTDGTAAGTTLLRQYVGGDIGANSLVAAGSRVVYAEPVSADSGSPTESAASDGTPAGTGRLADIGVGRTLGSGASGFVRLGDAAYFLADPGSLYRTDGTPAGTSLVPTGDRRPDAVAAANGRLYYTAFVSDGTVGGSSGTGLFATDGTSAGTLLGTYPQGSVGLPVAAGGSNYFVVATSGASGGVTYTLHKTDGTAAGTVTVADLATTDSFTDAVVIPGDGSRAFVAVRPSSQSGTATLYATDGTAAGTTALPLSIGMSSAAVSGGGGRAQPVGTVIGGVLHYLSQSFLGVLRLSDGTAAGTQDVGTDTWGDLSGRSLAGLNGDLYLTKGGVANLASGRAGLYRLAGGTGSPQRLTFSGTAIVGTAGGLLYFESRGVLSATAGATGPRVVTALPAGSSGVANLTTAGGFTFFTQATAAGNELWQTDGSATGRVTDLNPGRADGLPRLGGFNLAGYASPVVGLADRVVFTGLDPAAGAEPFAVTAGPLVGGGGGTLAGRVFADLDADGVPDADEGGAGGWTVFADLNANGVLDGGEPSLSLPTDAGGGYALAVAADQAVAVRLVARGGLAQTTVAPGPVAVSGGRLMAGGDFGVVAGTVPPPAGVGGTLTGVVYTDADGSGTRDAGEVGAAGRTVFADANANGALDAGEVSAVTDANGGYTLALTADQSVAVRLVPRAGFSRTTADPAVVAVGGGLATAGGDFGVVGDTVTPPPVNTPPTVSVSPAAVTIPNGGTSGAVTVQLGDAETPTALTFTLVSGDLTLLPAAGAVVTGSGATRTLTLTPAAGRGGTVDVVLTVTDAGGLTTTRTLAVTVLAPVAPPPPPVAPPPPGLVGSRQLAVGAAGGGGGARLYDSDGSVRRTFDPFPGFTGGVRTAAADFTGDGVAEVVAGTGPGRATRVVVLDGATGAELFQVDPFEATFTGGVFVAAGDITGDGRADLVISPDEGGGPRVRVFDGRGFGQLADFFGIDDPAFRGGARAGVGDLGGDGFADLLVAAGFGGGPRVAGFDGKALAAGNPAVKLFPDFFAFEDTLRNGVYVAAGDLGGDGFAELIAGAGPGGGPRVSGFDGRSLVQGGPATRTADFFAGDPDNRGGVRVAVKDLDGDGRADLVTGAGTGAGTGVTAYPGRTLVGGSPPNSLAFDAFAGFSGGVFVG